MAEENDLEKKENNDEGSGKSVESPKVEKTVKKKLKKVVEEGIAYVHATFNNTIVTITDNAGNVVSWSSAGTQGFKGSRKSTPFAAQVAADNAAKKAMNMGVKRISIYVKGPGAGRDAAIRALLTTGMTVNLIRDITPIPHNGCRPSKRRRV